MSHGFEIVIHELTRCPIEPIAGAKLYPAYDPFHEGEHPERLVEHDRFDLTAQRVPYGFVMDGNTTRDGDLTMLYSPAESVEHWMSRPTGRAAALAERTNAG